MQDIKKITIGFPQYFATLLSLIREKRCKFSLFDPRIEYS